MEAMSNDLTEHLLRTSSDDPLTRVPTRVTGVPSMLQPSARKAQRTSSADHVTIGSDGEVPIWYRQSVSEGPNAPTNGQRYAALCRWLWEMKWPTESIDWGRGWGEVPELLRGDRDLQMYS